jgi:hypothetical protein
MLGLCNESLEKIRKLALGDTRMEQKRVVPPKGSELFRKQLRQFWIIKRLSWAE